MASKVLLVTSQSIGGGEEQLGEMLMASFLRLLGESGEKPSSIIFMNGGVRLVAEGSRVIDHLMKLEGQGVELLACTTCLEYMDLMDKMKVGKPTTMARTIQSMMTADVITL